MFNITTVSALVLAAGMTMTANVQAEEVSVEQFVGNLIAQSTANTVQTLQYELQSAVLTAANSLGLEEQPIYAGKVKITELPSEGEVQKHVE